MNPENLLSEVEKCIAERPMSYVSQWVICWHENKFKCLPARVVKDDGNIFGRFHYDDLINGLTVDQWNRLSKRIAEFFEKEKLCQKTIEL